MRIRIVDLGVNAAQNFGFGGQCCSEFWVGGPMLLRISGLGFREVLGRGWGEWQAALCRQSP